MNLGQKAVKRLITSSRIAVAILAFVMGLLGVGYYLRIHAVTADFSVTVCWPSKSLLSPVRGFVGDLVEIESTGSFVPISFTAGDTVLAWPFPPGKTHLVVRSGDYVEVGDTLLYSIVSPMPVAIAEVPAAYRNTLSQDTVAVLEVSLPRKEQESVRLSCIRPSERAGDLIIAEYALPRNFITKVGDIGAIEGKLMVRRAELN